MDDKKEVPSVEIFPPEFVREHKNRINAINSMVEGKKDNPQEVEIPAETEKEAPK